MTRALAASVAIALSVTAAAAPPEAPPSGTEIRAVAGLFPPFVVEEEGRLTGFSVDLWKAIAAKLGTGTTIRLAPGTAAAFDALRTGQSDVVITGHFYTPERDREFDFTHSILNTGQQVLVRAGARDPGAAPLATYLRLITSRAMVIWLAAGMLLVLVPAHVAWLLDRRKGDLIPKDASYVPGIFHALGWAAEALLNAATAMPRRPAARLMAVLWIFCGVIFVSLLTAQLTAAITVERIHGFINGPDDLAGKVVATQAGSTTVPILRQLGARIEEFPQPDEAFEALLAGRADAVVLAAPALQYYESHQGSGKVRLVGPEFRKRDLGLMVPLHSPLRRRIDSALIELREDGTYERLREKWFGKE